MSKRKHDGEVDATEPPVKKRKLEDQPQGEQELSEENDVVMEDNSVTPEKHVQEFKKVPKQSPEEEGECVERSNEIQLGEVQQPFVETSDDEPQGNMDDLDIVGENQVCMNASKEVEELIKKQEEFQKKFLDSLGTIVEDFVNDMEKKFQEQQTDTEKIIEKVKGVVNSNNEKESQLTKAKEFAEEIFQKLSIQK